MLIYEQFSVPLICGKHLSQIVYILIDIPSEKCIVEVTSMTSIDLISTSTFCPPDRRIIDVDVIDDPFLTGIKTRGRLNGSEVRSRPVFGAAYRFVLLTSLLGFVEVPYSIRCESE